MGKFVIITLLLTASVSAFCERINGPANIRKTPNGEISFSLNYNVEIETVDPQNDWFEILVSIKLTKEQYETDPLIFTKGSTIYDMKGHEIGIILNDLKIGSKSTAGGAPGVPQWYSSEIYGYTYKSNIIPESIIEPVISRLIESNKGKLTIGTFKEHMRDFGYIDGLAVKNMKHLKTYMVYESMLDDLSPLDRIRLIFEGDNLIALVHSRRLTIVGFESVEIERGRKLVLVKDFEPNEKMKFIQKNKESYRGID